MKDSSADNLQEASFIARYRGRIVAVLWVGVLLWSAPLLHLYVGEGGPIAWISDFSFRWRPGCGYGSTSDLIRSVVVRTYLFFTPAFMGIIFIRILSKKNKNCAKSNAKIFCPITTDLVLLSYKDRLLSNCFGISAYISYKYR